jgi:hypothetical protein
LAFALLIVWASYPWWAWASLGIGALIWLQGLVSLSLRIRREREREAG